MTTYTEHRLIDLMGTGENALMCSCGDRIWPDCDVSSVSIGAAFKAHIDLAQDQWIATLNALKPQDCS